MEWVKAIAAGLAERFGTADPFAICENLEITVLTADLPDGVRGFYSCLLGVRVIYLNGAIGDASERRVVCAHELGHALLHKGCNSLFLRTSTHFAAERFEKEADLFAGYLLLDDATVYDCRCNSWNCGQISRFTGLSETVVEQCLSGAG